MTTDSVALLPCGECGMPCATGEYHPYAACLMFRGCHNSKTVRANLPPQRQDGELLALADRMESVAKAIPERTNDPAQVESWVARWATELRTLATERRGVDDCHWTYDINNNAWDTGCGNLHQFMVDGPAENGHGFCPYCGGKLIALQPNSGEKVNEPDCLSGFGPVGTNSPTDTVAGVLAAFRRCDNIVASPYLSKLLDRLAAAHEREVGELLAQLEQASRTVESLLGAPR